MTTPITGPFFEIGPKNFLRRAQLEALVREAGLAGSDYGVTVLVTVPTALIAPVADLHAGVLVFAQGMAANVPGPSMSTVIAESLIDAGADGVMLNHDSNPLTIGRSSSLSGEHTTLSCRPWFVPDRPRMRFVLHRWNRTCSSMSRRN